MLPHEIEDKKQNGQWKPDEDTHLINLINQHGAENWVRIASLLSTPRNAKQCRERYMQTLRPDLDHSPITEMEGQLINDFVAAKGNRWAELSRLLRTRSDNHIKNWFNSSSNRRKRNAAASFQNRRNRGQGHNSYQPPMPYSASSPTYAQHQAAHRPPVPQLPLPTFDPAIAQSPREAAREPLRINTSGFSQYPHSNAITPPYPSTTFQTQPFGAAQHHITPLPSPSIHPGKQSPFESPRTPLPSFTRGGIYSSSWRESQNIPLRPVEPRLHSPQQSRNDSLMRATSFSAKEFPSHTTLGSGVSIDTTLPPLSSLTPPISPDGLSSSRLKPADHTTRSNHTRINSAPQSLLFRPTLTPLLTLPTTQAAPALPSPVSASTSRSSPIRSGKMDIQSLMS